MGGLAQDPVGEVIRVKNLPFRVAVRKLTAEMDAAGKAYRAGIEATLKHWAKLQEEQDAREAPAHNQRSEEAPGRPSDELTPDGRAGSPTIPPA